MQHYLIGQEVADISMSEAARLTRPWMCYAFHIWQAGGGYGAGAHMWTRTRTRAPNPRKPVETRRTHAIPYIGRLW